MKREEALENLKKVFGCLMVNLGQCLNRDCPSCEYYYKNETLGDTLETIVDALENVPDSDEEKESKEFAWILAEQKLPEEEDFYLVTYETNFWEDMYYDPYVKVLFFDSRKGWKKWHREDRVTAWAKLPKPYMSEKEEEE